MSNFNYQILSADENLCIVIENNATKFEPYIFRGGKIYDCITGRPIGAPKRTKSIPTDMLEKAGYMVSEAKKHWSPAVSVNAEAPASAEPASIPAPTTSTPQTTLDTLIANAVAELSVNNVMATVKPYIDKYVADTYGVLPKVVKVETPTSSTEVKGITHSKFETILKLVLSGIPVFMTGPAGCGKNVICQQISEALNTEFYFTNAVTQEYKLTGFIDANGIYHETQFFKAFTQGGVFMLDEMDASIPEVLIILNAAIANGYFDFPNGKFAAHKDFHLIAAGNTYGTGADMEYTGRYQLDAASLDRFAIIEVNYDENIELAIANGDKKIVEFIHEFRKAIKSADIKFTVSYRAIDRLTKLTVMFDTREAISLAVLRGIDKDDAKMIAKNLPDINNNFIYELKKMMAA